MKTRKQNKNKNYIVVEKYETNILGGLLTHVYIIHINTAYSCTKNLTIKSRQKQLGQLLFKEPGLAYLTQRKISTTKLYKKDKQLMLKLKMLIDPTEKYTYCLNKNKLILAETKTKTNHSQLKNLLSKHILLCGNTTCASGEMIFHKGTMVFDNSSGTFEPSVHDIQLLKKILPFKMRIMNMNSQIHTEYFQDY